MGKRRALLIGVPEYKDSKLDSLPIVYQDLNALESVLRKSNYDVDVIGRKGKEETGRSDINYAIETVCRESKGVETLLLYLSGHGLHYNGRDYLVPADARIDYSERFENYLVSLDLGSAIDQCLAQTIVMVVDACREGVKLTESKSVALARWSRGERRQAAKRNLAVVFGCSQGEFSHFVSGEQGFSLFTCALAEVLDPEHPACTFSDVFDATQGRLNELSQEHQKSQQEIRIIQEFGATRDEQHRIICEGILPEESETIQEEIPTFQATPLVPWQMPAIPTTFVPRPEHSDELKHRLLSENESGTLVVSAIYGLGGIGKSVLATVLAHDLEVRQRFSDGVLWVTLGQNPDLQKCLGDWIQALRDFDYKPTTLGAASAHLRTLLFEKQMLLVVDDVWQSAHLDPFRVGGEACRVLVTTREAVITASDRHDLDVMTEDQSLALLEKGMNRSLTSSECLDVAAFVQAVGRLPLALELAAVQVNEGFSWQDLVSEFKKEVANLELLDSSEATQNLTEEQLRKHSLRACFNLSLRRLPPQVREQFAWLGVLPEDVLITSQMSATLWGINRLQAKKVLQTLRNRALLAFGQTSKGSEQSYRLHDLMHDTARWLITRSRETDLSGLGLSLPQAQQQFLERYRQQTDQGQWHTLKSDGYIHAHLTWHMEQAGCLDGIHELLRETTAEGRNGWYKACDLLGQPSIFVTDLSRARRLAKKLYPCDVLQSVVLQIRYALIFSSLKSLIGNIPAEVMAALVGKHRWSPAQALAYAQQATDSGRCSRIIQELAKYLPSALAPSALDVVGSIQSESDRVDALIELASHFPEVASEALDVVGGIQSESDRASSLSKLASHLSEGLLLEALKVARSIQSESDRADALIGLAPHLPEVALEALEIARVIQSEYSRADVLRRLAPHLSEELLIEALEVARGIQSEYSCVYALSRLAPYLPEVVSEALEVAHGIQSEYSCAYALIELAPHLPEVASEALVVVRSIQSESYRAYALIGLAPHLPEVALEVLEIARVIQSEYSRADVLRRLAPHLSEGLLIEALEVARGIRDEYSRADVLRGLAPHLSEGLLIEALEVARGIRDEYSRADVLRGLAPHLPEELLIEALDVVCGIQSEYSCTYALIELAPHLPEVVSEALEVARSIQSESDRAYALRGLAPHLSKELLIEALDSVRVIQSESDRADALRRLAPHLSEGLLIEALEVARGIQSESSRVFALSELAPHLPDVVAEVLEVARGIQSESSRVSALSELAPHLPDVVAEVLEVARSIQSASSRVSALRRLAPHLPEVVSEALEAARSIQSESSRASALRGLVPHLPEGLLMEALEVAHSIRDESSRAFALSELAPRLRINSQNYSLLSSLLNDLAYGGRKNFLEDIPKLAPSIIDLAGPQALPLVVKSMREVCKQWP